jgi:TRAP-type C4-dicarboxylate transport system substrate-binding protein
MRVKSILALSAACVAISLHSSQAAAQEVTLRAVSSFAEGSFSSAPFERFIEKVNKDGKGVIQINYIGGPRAIPPFEVGNAVRSKVVDIANVAAAFYTNLMPEADAVKLLNKPAAEQRKNGTFELLEQIHQQKLNSHYLARQFVSVPYHFYVNKKLDKLDFSGLKIRVTPVYRDLVQTLNGTSITTPPGEVYTALERNVVDGYGWPALGVFDFGWDKVTKFRIDPGFYSVDVGVLVNTDAWKGLNEAQRKVLTDAALWLESLDDTENPANVNADRDRQAKAGIETLNFGPAVSAEFVKKANSLAWDAVIARSPEFGKKLRAINGD